MNALDRKFRELGLLPATDHVPSVSPPSESGDTDKHTYPASRYPEKHKTRRDALNLLRNSKNPSRLWYEGRLTCDWLELCGEAPDATCGYLLEEGVLTPNTRYIGLNLDPGIIGRNEQAYAFAGSKTKWLCGYAEHLLLDLDNPDLKNVGVLAFDAFYSVSNKNMENLMAPVLSFAKAQYDRMGQFLLIVNRSMRGNVALSIEEGRHQFNDIIRRHCGIREIPESAYTEYVSRKLTMRTLRLTYGW